MNKVIRVFILAWLVVFLQSSLISMFAIQGISPNLMAVLVSVVGLTVSTDAGILTGLLTGFMADCYRPETMGLFTICGVISGFLVGVIKNRVYRERILTKVLVSGLLTFLHHVFEFWGHGGAGLLFFLKYLLRFGLGGAIYTMLISFLLIPLIHTTINPEIRSTVRSKCL